MMKLNPSNSVFSFIKDLGAKQFKQIVSAMFSLLKDPTPPDSSLLKGYPGYYRKDVGEYRIIYSFNSEEVFIILAGKRNDDEVYKELKRKLG